MGRVDLSGSIKLMKSRKVFDKKVNELLDGIEIIRRKNNKNWMQILRIAFREAPEEAQYVMVDIAMCNKKMGELMGKLGGDL